MNQFLFGTPWPWWPILLCGAGAGVLTWRGYTRRSAELDSHRLKLLNILRIIGWALLFFCLLQPMSRQYTREEKANRLTVLIDDSESMSFADKRDGRSRIDGVKIALGGLAALSPEAPKEPALAMDSNSLLNKLSQNFRLQLEAFGPSTRTIANLQELKAAGESTDIAKALTESFGRLKGPDTGGLLLVTDGADTARGDIDRIAVGYKRAGIPIYVLGVGQPNMQDLAIEQVRCRRTVSKDTLVRVEVDVRKQGIPDGVQSVYIKHNGRQVGEKKVLDMKGETGTAIFEFLPADQGFLEYEATVEPFPGELVIANNTMAFGLVAHSRKLKVLYAEGSMYIHRTYNSLSKRFYYDNPMQDWWETDFFKKALEEDTDVEVDVLAKDAFVSPRNVAPPNVPTVDEGWPKTKKALYQYDVIISSDIPITRFSPEQIQAQVDFVAKHGGGFCMVGGYTAFAEGHYAKTPIDRMLPVEMLDETHVDGEDFNWRITDDGYNHEIMQIEKDPEKNRVAWDGLPQFHGFSRTTHKKPAATVLAEVADDKFDTAYGPAVLIAVQNFGSGRSMAFTTDMTGSWGTEWEDTWGPEGSETDQDHRNEYYKTFWKNAIRWLAAVRMKQPNQIVQIESDRLVYGRGEQPEIRVKVMNEDYELTHDAKVMLTIIGPNDRPQQVAVFPRYEEPGIYERKLELKEVGRYEIEAAAMLGKEELGRDKTILQVRPASAEMRELSQNVPLLKKLAGDTGGKYLPLENASELPRYLREATHVIEKHRDIDLWDNGWIFVLIVSLLCGEWFLRKRSGLP